VRVARHCAAGSRQPRCGAGRRPRTLGTPSVVALLAASPWPSGLVSWSQNYWKRGHGAERPDRALHLHPRPLGGRGSTAPARDRSSRLGARSSGGHPTFRSGWFRTLPGLALPILESEDRAGRVSRHGACRLPGRPGNRMGRTPNRALNVGPRDPLRCIHVTVCGGLLGERPTP